MRAWLRWQTRVTKGAAAAATAWARRLAAHPVIGQALAAGEISASWARELCCWSDRLPAGKRDDGDEILVAAARGGADLADLAGLAEEMYQRSRQDSPDGDTGGGFADRGVWLGVTLGGAGRLDGDLTAGCAAALTAVLESLGKKAGPEDDRSAAQRRHDALEEACRRLIAAGMLPGRASQPAQAQVHITLSQLSVSDFLCAELFAVRYRMFIRSPLLALSDAVVPGLFCGLAESGLPCRSRADAACPGFCGSLCYPGRLLPDPLRIAWRLFPSVIQYSRR